MPGTKNPTAPAMQAFLVKDAQQKCCILSKMIPQFTDEGMLPPGVHETDLDELREKMGWSRKRRELLEGLEVALELMATCGVVTVYLNGSFVMDKRISQTTKTVATTWRKT